MTSESLGDLAHLPVLKYLPQVVGRVEHDALQEQDEGDPLVVGVEHLLVLGRGGAGGPHSLIGEVHSSLAGG